MKRQYKCKRTQEKARTRHEKDKKGMKIQEKGRTMHGQCMNNAGKTGERQETHAQSMRKRQELAGKDRNKAGRHEHAGKGRKRHAKGMT